MIYLVEGDDAKRLALRAICNCEGAFSCTDMDFSRMFPAGPASAVCSPLIRVRGAMTHLPRLPLVGGGTALEHQEPAMLDR